MQQGSKIREARLAKGMSQSDLAAALGVSKPAVSRYELGQRHLRPDQLQDVSRVLSIPIVDLLELEPEKRAELEELKDVLSTINERFENGYYLGEADRWIPTAAELLQRLLDREMMIAAAADKSQAEERKQGDTEQELPEVPQQRKTKKRMNRLEHMFTSLNDEGQRFILDFMKVIVQVPDFQPHLKKPDIYSVLTQDESMALKQLVSSLDEETYERYEYMQHGYSEAYDIMSQNSKSITDIKGKIAEIVIGAVKRSDSTDS